VPFGTQDFGSLVFSTTSIGLFSVRFRFAFSTGAILKDFSALFSGLFRFVFGGQAFVINNFSGLFF